MLDILISLLIICAIIVVSIIVIGLFTIAIYIIKEITKFIIEDLIKRKTE